MSVIQFISKHSTRRMSYLLDMGPSNHGRSSFKLSAANHANKPNSSVSNPVFNFQSYHIQKVDSINKALDIATSFPRVEEIIIRDSIRYSLLEGGKRVRPLLCIAACELVGGSESTAMPAACAVEMIHVSSLIHDDLPCMDNGDIRNWKPTNHKKFSEYVALLAGYALIAYSFEHVTHSTAPCSQVVRVIRELSNATGIGGVALGQVADMRSQGVKCDVRMERLEYIHFYKCSRLLEAAVVSGAILGGGSVVEIESLRMYAKCMGLLLQLVDDVMDLTKSTEESGKTTGKDVRDGKVTYPKVVGLDKTKEIASELILEGKGYLAMFEVEKSAPLIALADYIASRLY